MIGKVAKCQRGKIGLITTVMRSKSGRKPLYTGVCLDRGRVGLLWQSINPELIGTLDDWVKRRYEELAIAVSIKRSKSERCASDECTPTRRNLLT